jgi:hypothetical protein
MAEMKMAATTARPASFSPRLLRRKNAMPSGIAVSASPKLWIRSASNATDPVVTKINVCTSAVAPRIRRLIATALRPSCDRTIERSTSP